MQERVLHRLHASQALATELMETLVDVLVQAAESLFSCFVHDRKLILLSDDVSFQDLYYFYSCLTCSFENDRPALKAFCLEQQPHGSLVARHERFSKQLSTMAEAGDILVIFALSERIEDCVSVIQEAHDYGMSVLSILGPNSISLLDVLNENDIVIPIDRLLSAHVKEMRLMVIHVLLDLIDGFLLG